MLWRMSAERHFDRIGIMLARLDNLPQRHRSVALHAAAPGVDFRTSMRRERIRGPTPRHRPLADRLRKLRELQEPGGSRPAPGREIGITLAEIAGIPAMTRPRETATNSRAGRKGRKGRKLIFAVHPTGETAKLRTAVSVRCLGLRGLRSSEGSGVGSAEPVSPMTRDRPRH
jgi:hypothetical protein